MRAILIALLFFAVAARADDSGRAEPVRRFADEAAFQCAWRKNDPDRDVPISEHLIRCCENTPHFLSGLSRIADNELHNLAERGERRSAALEPAEEEDFVFLPGERDRLIRAHCSELIRRHAWRGKIPDGGRKYSLVEMDQTGKFVSLPLPEFVRRPRHATERYLLFYRLAVPLKDVVESGKKFVRKEGINRK